MRRELPSIERLRELFSYDPETGELRWKWRADVPVQWNTRYAGRVAGHPDCRGYISVGIDHHPHQAHRVIWKLVTGEEPGEIDHKDVDGRNNRFPNLRSASRFENLANTRMRPRNQVGYKGVRQMGPSYEARIRVRGTRIHLGVFPTPEAAHAAYAAAAEKHFGEFARGA